MLKGFKDFIMRGNVIDLSIAVVMGAAFSSVVTAFTNKIVQPLLNAVSPPTSQGLGITLTQGKASTYIDISALITAALNFILVAAVVYFAIVLPMRTIQQRRKRGEEAGPSEPTDIELLKEIRDLLKSGSRSAAADRWGSTGPEQGEARSQAVSAPAADYNLTEAEPELFTQPGAVRSVPREPHPRAPVADLSGPAVPPLNGRPVPRDSTSSPTPTPDRPADETGPVGEYSVGSMSGEWRQIAPGPGGGSVGPVSGRPQAVPEEPDWHPGPGASERDSQHERRPGSSRRHGID